MLSPWISILKTVFFCRTLYICKLLVIMIVIIKTEEFPQWDVGVKSGQEKALFSSFSYKWGWEKFKINITFLQLWLETKLKSGLKLHPDFGSLFLCDERYTDILTIYFYFIYVFLGTSFWQNKQPLEWTDRLGFFFVRYSAEQNFIVFGFLKIQMSLQMLACFFWSKEWFLVFTP